MIKKETAAHSHHNAIPNNISFKGTVQLLNHFMPLIIDMNMIDRIEAYHLS